MIRPEPIKIPEKKSSFTGKAFDSPSTLSVPMKLMLEMM